MNELVDTLKEQLTEQYIKYFGSPLAAPQAWGTIRRLSSINNVAKTKQKLESIKNNTDRHESAAASQALKLMKIFQDYIKENHTDILHKVRG